ncbi:MAG: CHAT domain-containing protein [Stigonema ocellatum SAG 48.90 = DSM 106950]|nr:CHAT domain-containing protein [Stigonema ocellatum SAG 48.90 = DSM 106950]
MELSKLALTIFQEIKVPRMQAFAHRMLSIGYGELGNDAQAMAEAQNFLAYAKKVQNPVWSKSALSLLGSLHQKFGRKQDAIATYQAALAIKTDTQVLGGDSGIYAGLAMVYRDLNQPSVAIAYYKDAINGIQQVRRNIQGLPPQLQNSFLQATYDFGGVKVSDIYKQLADLLRQLGQDTEAFQVVELLKIQELREFTRSVDLKADIPLTRGEQKIKEAQSNLIAFGQRVYECEQKKCPQLQELITQRDNLNREFIHKVNEIVNSINFKDPNLIYPGKFLDAATSIVQSQPGTIMISPLVFDDKIVIFLASRGVVVKSIEVKGIGQQQLKSTVERYRQLLQNSSDIAEVKATSKQLYDWLIKPIEAELKNNKIQNLVFALDSYTRYIPMSSLFDGSKYLVENYQVSTVISASLTNLGEPLPPGTENTQVLAVGLSDQVTGFNPLPNVPKELEAIVHENAKSSTGIYPGLKLLNKAFDFSTLRSNLSGKKILHIATHGAFVPEEPTASYILSGKGEKIPITDIQLLQNLGSINLVVLSACETALGGHIKNGVEISGISSFFIGNGKASAAIASLWQVNDASTTLLMQEFYHNLASGKMTKSSALRQAQLSLLHGLDSKGKNLDERGIKVTPTPGKPARASNASGFSHPYYWAPFILIGNGL